MTNLLKNPLTFFSFFVLSILLILAIFPSQIAPMDPQKANYDALRSPPSRDHIMGTDYAGRDIASRVIYGVRTTLIIFCSYSFKNYWVCMGVSFRLFWRMV